MPVEVTKVDKGELLILENPKYQEVIARNPHLSGVVMNDVDTKSRLPVHIILGAGDFAKLKTESVPKIGEPGQPVAELTKFGWIIMSPGKEPLDLTNVLLTQTSHVDYEELCRLDVLGLSDTPPNDQSSVYAEFKEQLVRHEEGWYETGLPWRGNHPVLPNNKEIEQIDLHSFGDACSNGVAACNYAVIRQASGTKQGLIAARSRLSKQELTIPRLELVSGHMAVNLVDNVKDALDGLPVRSTHCWLDSSVALYWIRGQGEYKQFVANRVQKINSHKEVTWRYVPTAENPTDLASHGGHVEKADLWWHGPKWLGFPEHWPADVLNEQSEESQTEVKLVQKVLGVAVNEKNEIAEVLHRFQLQKAVRICAWMRRFAHNSLRSRGTPRIKGPLTTEETNRQRLFWEKQAQRSCDIERDRVALNLQPNQEGLLECWGRIQGEYPVYIPETSILGLRPVEEAHKETMHGGVGLTMARVRARYWIPKLRQLTKKVRKSCHGCKKFQASAYAAPPPGNLPTTRTQGTNPYQVIGVDYAGPIRYRVSKQREGKAYVLLYACSLT